MTERNVQDQGVPRGVPRSTWTLEQQALHWFEMQEQRAAWEQQRKLQREQEERGKKQARLKEYLDLRSSVYLDLTSTSPTQAQLATWTEEFISSQTRRAEGEREKKRQRSEAENYNF